MKSNLKLQEFLSGKNSIKIILIVAAVGVALIVGSEFMESPSPKKVSDQEPAHQYEEALEVKIAEVVSAITGESEPNVMITLESTGKSIYATENKEKNKGVGEDVETEEKYIIVKNSDGTQEALLVTELEPEVKGIVIVSKFAGNAVIRENIINAVRTVLNLSSNKVCVVSKSN